MHFVAIDEDVDNIYTMHDGRKFDGHGSTMEYPP